MVEIQHPSETILLLTAELGPDNSPPGSGFEYDEDTALQPDGKTRILGFTRNFGKGRVTYIALGHRSAPHRNQPLKSMHQTSLGCVQSPNGAVRGGARNRRRRATTGQDKILERR